MTVLDSSFFRVCRSWKCRGFESQLFTYFAILNPVSSGFLFQNSSWLMFNLLCQVFRAGIPSEFGFISQFFGATALFHHHYSTHLPGAVSPCYSVVPSLYLNAQFWLVFDVLTYFFYTKIVGFFRSWFEFWFFLENFISVLEYWTQAPTCCDWIKQSHDCDNSTDAVPIRDWCYSCLAAWFIS